MSSTEGEDKPPVQDEVSDGGMPGTANYCQETKLSTPKQDPMQVPLLKLVGI